MAASIEKKGLCVVVGAGGGLGRSICLRFAKAGYVSCVRNGCVCTAALCLPRVPPPPSLNSRTPPSQTVVAMTRKQESAQGALDAIKESGGEASWKHCDATEEVKIKEAFEGIGTVDVLVYNVVRFGQSEK